jgi:AraC-like DNA-binding protein
MDDLVNRIYPVAMVRAEKRERIVSIAELPTPIGMMRYGGRLQGTRGTGFTAYRTYGLFALVLILEGGSGRYRDQLGHDRRLKAGDLIVVFPDVAHQYGPEENDVWDEVHISFDGAAFEGWRAHGLDPANPVWSLTDEEDWPGRFYDILQMPVTNRSEACAAAGAIHQLIADAVAAKASTSSPHDWLENACQALSGGTGAPTVQEIAQNARLGYETFRKIFKAATGESPARYRRRMRLAQATLMLRRSDLSLDMIADALDFCDAFHLSKAFKLHYGISPAEQRKKWHKDDLRR